MKRDLPRADPDTAFDFETASIRTKIFDYYVQPPGEDGVPQQYRAAKTPRLDTEHRCAVL